MVTTVETLQDVVEVMNVAGVEALITVNVAHPDVAVAQPHQAEIMIIARWVERNG
jgi:hypothetical protein